MCVQSGIFNALKPQPVRLVAGETYRLRSGGEYRCVGFDGDEPVLCNTVTLWTFTAHDVVRYPSGLIEWSHSTGGHFADPEVYTWLPK